MKPKMGFLWSKPTQHPEVNYPTSEQLFKIRVNRAHDYKEVYWEIVSAIQKLWCKSSDYNTPITVQFGLTSQEQVRLMVWFDGEKHYSFIKTLTETYYPFDWKFDVEEILEENYKQRYTGRKGEDNKDVEFLLLFQEVSRTLDPLFYYAIREGIHMCAKLQRLGEAIHVVITFKESQSEGYSRVVEPTALQDLHKMPNYFHEIQREVNQIISGLALRELEDGR